MPVQVADGFKQDVRLVVLVCREGPPLGCVRFVRISHVLDGSHVVEVG